MRKRNSFTIGYLDLESPTQLNYGRVEKFLTCPADNPDCIHIAVIQRLQVDCCSNLLSLVFPPEIKSVAPFLCSDFVMIVGEHQENVAISMEHILFKCFDISTVGFTALTTLVNESEVSK